MRRWFWALLTLSGVALAVAFAVFPFAGHNNVRTYAHIVDLDGDTVVTGPGDAHLEIDMNPTNGSGPCNPVDDTANVTVGQTYSVAVCLTSAGRIGDVGNEPNAFNFNLVYDDSLNQCQPKTCGAGTSDASCYDSNPDTNMGVTTFPSAPWSATANAAVTTDDTSLTDTRAAWTAGQFVGSVVTCNGKTMTVTSNTATTLTGATGVPLAPGWSGGGNPGNGNAYTITTPDLGGSAVGYDCTGVGKALPVCDKNTGTAGPGLGVAYIGCFTTGTPTLPVGDVVSAPLAEVTFKANAGGVDHLSLTNVVITSSDYGATIVACPGGIGFCFGGTDFKGPTPTLTVPATPTATNTVAPTATNTVAPTATNTVAPTATNTVAPTATNTVAPTATNTVAPTATNTVAPTATNTVAPTATNTVAPTATNTVAPTATNTVAPTATNTVGPTATNTVAPTATNTVAPTATNTVGPTATNTFTPTATNTFTPTATNTFTPTATNTFTPTATNTVGPTATNTVAPVATNTFTPTATKTRTPTATKTRTPTPASRTPTATKTRTPTPLDRLIERIEQLVDRACGHSHNSHSHSSFECRQLQALLNLLERLRGWR